MSLKRILNSRCAILTLLFVFFTPEYLIRNAIVNLVSDALRVVGFLLLCVMFFSDIRGHIKKRYNIFLIALWIELLISTLHSASNGASFYTYASNVTTTLGMCFLVAEIAMHNPHVGLESVYIYFSAIVLINTATVFIYPNAMYANNGGRWVCWFLGEDNGGYAYYIIASTVGLIYTQYISKKNTVFSWMVWISAFIFVFYRDIATGIVCQVIWAALILEYQFRWFRKLLKARYVFYAIFGSFVVVVMLRRFILEPIVSALGRSITLTGRTFIWDRVFERIQSNLLLGFGVRDGVAFDSMIMNRGLYNAHNWLLMLMFYGGIISIVLFSISVICACQDASRSRGNLFYCSVVIGLIVFSVRFLVEAGSMPLMFVTLSLLAYSNEYTQGLEKVQIKKIIAIKNAPRIKLVRGNQV